MRLTAILLVAIAMPLLAQQHRADHSFGATTRSSAKGIGYDADGNLYIAGGFKGTINLTPGGADTLACPDDAMYVVKYTPRGTLAWSRMVSAPAPGYIGIEAALATPAGDFFVMGGFNNIVDFEPATGNFLLQSRDYGGAPGSGPSSFIARYDTDGNIVWMRQLDGGLNIARQAAQGPNGELFVTGMMSNTVDLDPGPGQVMAIGSGILASYLLALDANGDYLWSHYYVGGLGATLMDAAADSHGNVHVCGLTNGTLYLASEPTQPQIQPTGNVDSFAIKYNAQGQRQWIRHWGSAGNVAQFANDVCVDAAGNAIVTGSFRGSVDFDNGPGDATLTATTTDDAFALKLLPNGDLAWAKNLGATEYVQPPRCDADPTGIYIGGHVPMAPVAGNITYLLKLDAAGNTLWTRSLGHSPYVFGVFALAVGPAGRLAMCGHFNGYLGFNGGGAHNSSVPDTWWHELDQPSLHAPLDFTPDTLPATTVGDTAAVSFMPSGGSTIGYTWRLASGTLPPGVTCAFGAADELVMGGMTDTAGAWQFEIELEDDFGNTAIRAYHWQVDVPPPVTAPEGDAGKSAKGAGCAADRAATWPLALLAVLFLTTLAYRRIKA